MSTSQIPYTLIEEQPTSLIQNQSPQGNPITQQYGNKQGKGHATTKPTAPHKTPSTGQYDWVYTLLQVYACISTIFCIPLGVTAFVAADRASKNYQGGFRKKAAGFGITSFIMSTICIGIIVTLIVLLIYWRNSFFLIVY